MMYCFLCRVRWYILFFCWFFIRTCICWLLLSLLDLRLINFLTIYLSRSVSHHDFKLLKIKSIIVFIMLIHTFHNFLHQNINCVILNFQLLKIFDLLFSSCSKFVLSDKVILVHVMVVKLNAHLLLWKLQTRYCWT